MPRGVYERKAKEVPVESQPDEHVGATTVTEAPQPKVSERVRKYSTEKDLKGMGEPLCLNCEHRSDMHYIEKRWSEQRVGKNFLGETITYEVQQRAPIYDGERPCQHACLCKKYE